MSETRIPNGLFFAIVLAAIAQCVHDFPLLPDRLASHFGASGMPNGWMTKPQFFITYAVVLLPAFIVEFWVHRKVAKTPEAKLRLPNKEYWLAAERRAETLAYFEIFFAWFGCAFPGDTGPCGTMALLQVGSALLTSSGIPSGSAKTNGTYALTAVTAPEPSSYALMLLGVGLVFVMRKRVGQGLPQAS